MRRIRFQKDINVKWKILVNGLETDITGFDLNLELTDAYERTRNIEDFTINNGNEIEFTLYGVNLTTLGKYTVTLWLNKGKAGQSVLDHRDIFQLVKYTNQESEGDTSDDLDVYENVEITGSLDSISTSGQVIGDYVTRNEMNNILDRFVQTNDISNFLKPEDVSDFLREADLSLDNFV